MEKEQIIETERLKMDICRFCLSEDVKLAHIYSASKKLGSTIAEAAMECTNVQISLNDGMPLYVCKNCYLKLQDVQQFKKMVLKSDAVLRTYHRPLCFDENTLRINYPSMDEPLGFDDTRCTDQSSDDEIITEDTEFDLSNDVVEETVVKNEISNEESQTKTVISCNSQGFDLGNDVVEETVVKSEISNEESQTKTVISSNGQIFRVHIDIDNINESFEKQVIILIPNNEKMLTDNLNSRNNLTSNEQTTSNAPEKSLEKSDNLPCNNSVENMFEANTRKDLEKSGNSLKNHVYDSAVGSSVADDTDDWHSEEVTSKDDNSEKESDKDENTFLKCEICKRSFTRKDNLRTHILSKHGSDGKNTNFQCEICEKSFARKYSLRRHVRKMHESNDSTTHRKEIGIYSCSICNEIFKEYSDYYSHKVRHFDQNYQPGKPLQCNVCGKYFKKLFYLKQHSRRHDNDDRPFQCTKCDKKFKTKYELASHQRIHDDTTEFHSLCPICGKAIKYANAMLTHIRVRHSEKRPHMCHICGKTFKNLSSLKEHKEIHVGKMIECTICNKSFKGKHLLRKHNKNSHHGKEFKCNICFKISSSQQTLGIHIKSVHEKKREFDCSECKKTFASYIGLKFHKQSSHRVKSFECEECGKCFSRKDFLVMHLRMHSGEKPYKCDDCDKRFSRNDNLKTHKKKVHNKSMKYKCRVCDKEFKMKCELDNHIEDKHNVPM